MIRPVRLETDWSISYDKLDVSLLIMRPTLPTLFVRKHNNPPIFMGGRGGWLNWSASQLLIHNALMTAQIGPYGLMKE